MFRSIVPLLLVVFTCPARCEQPPAHYIAPDGIAGSLVIVGGGSVPDLVAEVFVEIAGGADARIVVIPAAAADGQGAGDRTIQWLKGLGAGNISLMLHENRDAAEAEDSASLLAGATGVWFTGGQQQRIADLYVGTPVEAALADVLNRDGVIGGTSAGAAIMSRVMIASGLPKPNITTGLNLLPGAIIDQHFTQRKRMVRLESAVTQNADHFGLGINESTAVIVRGRRLQVIGDGDVTVLLAASPLREQRVLTLDDREVADLTQLRRAARKRSWEHIEAASDTAEDKSADRTVPHGSLVIVGGGGMPPEISERFVNLAGGEASVIAVLPTAGSAAAARSAGEPGFLKAAGAGEIIMLPEKAWDEVTSDKWRDAMNRATGVWFGGGRQWNFVDAYEDTGAIELFHAVLKRGGSIAGSSAGASIQAEFMVRGHPLGNTVMMAEGYEQGFNFLPQAAVDQHFAQRNRFADLIPVIEAHPELLGIGIDETTAIVVQGSTAEVIGEHSTHFLLADRIAASKAKDAEEANVETGPTGGIIDEGARIRSMFISLQRGERFDLVERKKLTPAEPAGETGEKTDAAPEQE